MRLALPNLLVLSILPAAMAQQYHRGTLSKGQERKSRRKAKAEPEKKHYTVGDLRVHVSPKSGEIAVSRGKMGKARDKASTVKILIKSIREVDAEGNAVGQGEEEAEVHSFASLKDTEFEIEVGEYDAPIEIEDDADATLSNDEEDGETHAGNDIVDAVDGDGGEIPTGNDTVDAVGEEGEETASTEEVTDSTDPATGSDGLRRYLQDIDTTPSPITEGQEEDEGGGGELEGEPAEPESEPEIMETVEYGEGEANEASVATDEAEEVEEGGEPEEEEEQEGVTPNTVADIAEPAPADAPATAAEGGAEGVKVSLSAMLQTESDIRVEMWLVSGGGAVGTTSEQWAVRPGDSKFNIQLTRWTFCDPCTEGTGEFVDVLLQIKGGGAAGPKPKDKGARIEDADRKGDKGKKDDTHKEGGKKGKTRREEHAWDLGEGATLDLTSRVRVDGVWEDMPDGFPKFVNEGGKQYYTLRFPRFNDNIWYDPVVSFDEDFDSSASASRFVSRIATCGAMLLLSTFL